MRLPPAPRCWVAGMPAPWLYLLSPVEVLCRLIRLRFVSILSDIQSDYFYTSKWLDSVLALRFCQP